MKTTIAIVAALILFHTLVGSIVGEIAGNTAGALFDHAAAEIVSATK